MDIWEALALLGAGTVAGAINAVVGSGTLVTFPTLLAFGYPPVVANGPGADGYFYSPANYAVHDYMGRVFQAGVRIDF